MMTAGTATRTDDRFLKDVLDGLSRPHKRLPSRYFYDAAGSRLFDRITKLDEYYLTRSELSILHSHAGRHGGEVRTRALLIEFGAGSLTKVRWLLERLDRPAGYVPVDVSGEHLLDAAAELAIDFPRLLVRPVVADFTEPFDVPPIPARRRVAYFPGSTIGNFDPPDANALLGRIARLVGRGGGLLLGVDLRKSPAVLEPAYNDSLGVTADFNKNLLVRINRELGADFDVAAFRHLSFFNIERSRIEMHLVSAADQVVHLGGRTFTFRTGESIRTECSYKYDVDELSHRAFGCGLRRDHVWMSENGYFAVLHFTAIDLPSEAA